MFTSVRHAGRFIFDYCLSLKTFHCLALKFDKVCYLICNNSYIHFLKLGHLNVIIITKIFRSVIFKIFQVQHFRWLRFTEEKLLFTK